MKEATERNDEFGPTDAFLPPETGNPADIPQNGSCVKKTCTKTSCISISLPRSVDVTLKLILYGTLALIIKTLFWG